MSKKNNKLYRICDAFGCELEGIYPAPKSREKLNEYCFFCLEHIREYNKSWNYFEGLNEVQFEREIRKATTWDRPSWKFGTKRINDDYKFIFDMFQKDRQEKKKPIDKELLDSWKILDLKPESTIKDVKKKYKTLAKKWHPDTTLNLNKDNKKNNETFVLITKAYEKIIKSLTEKTI